MPDSNPLTRCPHCGGDLRPGVPRHRRMRLPHEPVHPPYWDRFRWWHLGLALMLALLGAATAIALLSRPPPLPEAFGA